jgi:DNA primase small subunit
MRNAYNSVDPATLQNREFSFTINHNGQEIYIRYLSYGSAADFKQDLLEKCPQKIDIGAVYSGKPKMKNSLKLFKPVQVF